MPRKRPQKPSLAQARLDGVKLCIRKVLKRTKGNVVRAAEELAISRSALYHAAESAGLDLGAEADRYR